MPKRQLRAGTSLRQPKSTTACWQSAQPTRCEPAPCGVPSLLEERQASRLLAQHLKGEDPILFLAAVKTAEEIPGQEVSDTADRRVGPGSR